MNLAKIFSSSKKRDEVPTTQDAIEKLRNTEEILTKKCEDIENEIKTKELTAKENCIENKQLALEALKCKRDLEKQLQSVDNVCFTIEVQQENLENAVTHDDILKALGYSAKALTDMETKLNVVKGIGDTGELSGLSLTSEDDLIAELKELEENDFDRQV